MMSEPETNEVAGGDANPPSPGWRFWLGTVLFVLAWLAPLGVPLVALSDLPAEAKATLSGLLLVGVPEAFSLLAIALLGKPGFAYARRRLMALLRRYGPPRVVGRARYYVGLTMLFLPGLCTWILAYAADSVPGYIDHRIPVNLMLDLLFFSSFFVLGGDFWDKVRALFIYEARARFPEPVGG